MIFLKKSDSKSGYYEIKLYKNKPTDKYIPSEYDKHVISYEENDEFIIFFFKDYEHASKFIEIIQYLHPEFKERPLTRLEFE